MGFLRQPIISVLGHVDHGKTSLLDFIRESRLIKKEAGGITQHIGATEVTSENISKFVKHLIPEEKIKIPGLLFIDTPGHKSFTSLRKRGGNISDIGILIVDINEGFKPQTEEALEILRNSKTPFVIAANKLDNLPTWQSKQGSLANNIEAQQESARYKLDEKLYEIVGKVAEFGVEADRFDRINDFTKKVSIVPISSKTGEGIQELLATIIGLTQKYFEKKLTIEDEDVSRGVILEVKDYPGLGKCLDTIVHDGVMNSSDSILALTTDGVKESKIKSILKPAILKEIRDSGTDFKSIKSVPASAGVKVSAPELDEVQAGMPFITTSTKNEDLKEIYRQELLDEMKDIEILGGEEGVLVKADTLGSLEALDNILKENDINIRKAKVGKVTKTDVMDVAADLDTNPKNALLLAFNLRIDSEVKELARKYGVTIISGEVIYKLVDDALEWLENKEKEIRRKKLEGLTLPFKAKILENCIFRVSNPAVVGVEAQAGTLKKAIPLITDEGKKIAGGVKSIKIDNENAPEMKEGEEGAVAIDKMTVNRNAFEGTVLYSFMGEENFRKLKKEVDLLSSSEKAAMKEIASLMRREEPRWGI